MPNSIFIFLQLLHVVEAFIVAVLRYELVVLTAFHNFTFVDDMYDVCILDSRESMSNGDGGSALHQTVQSLLHEVLAFRIEGRCGLVQNEDWRVLQDGSSYADSLSLTA